MPHTTQPHVRTVSDAGLVTSRGPLGPVTIAAAQGELTAPIDLGVGTTRGLHLLVATGRGYVHFIDRTSRVLLKSVPIDGDLRRPTFTPGGIVVVPNESGNITFLQ